LNYTTAQIKVRDASLNIRILAEGCNLPLEPGTIIAQLSSQLISETFWQYLA
jgi:hypothetical protein